MSVAARSHACRGRRSPAESRAPPIRAIWSARCPGSLSGDRQHQLLRGGSVVATEPKRRRCPPPKAKTSTGRLRWAVRGIRRRPYAAPEHRSDRALADERRWPRARERRHQAHAGPSGRDPTATGLRSRPERRDTLAAPRGPGRSRVGRPGCSADHQHLRRVAEQARCAPRRRPRHCRQLPRTRLVHRLRRRPRPPLPARRAPDRLLRHRVHQRNAPALRRRGRCSAESAPAAWTGSWPCRRTAAPTRTATVRPRSTEDAFATLRGADDR